MEIFSNIGRFKIIFPIVLPFLEDFIISQIKFSAMSQMGSKAAFTLSRRGGFKANTSKPSSSLLDLMM